MFSIKNKLEKIEIQLSQIQSAIKRENKVGMFGLNVFHEETVIKLLNIVFGYSFGPVNNKRTNYPGIDGLDEKNKCLLQITSDGTLKKVKSTFEKLQGNYNLNDFSEVVFFYLVDVPQSASNRIETIKAEYGIPIRVIDFSSIYQELFYNRNIELLNKIGEILNIQFPEGLNISQSNIEIIMLSFDDHDVDDALSIAEQFINRQINIVTSSKKLIQKLKSQDPKLLDFVVPFREEFDSSIVSFSVVILSHIFIRENFSDSVKCMVLEWILNSESKVFALSKEDKLKNISLIHDFRIRNFKNLNHQHLYDTVDDLLHEKLVESTYSNISIEMIVEELAKTFNNFEVIKAFENEDCILLNFKLSINPQIQFDILVLNSDFSLKKLRHTVEILIQQGKRKGFDVLVPKDFTHKTRRRLDLIQRELQCKSIHYIDEYFYDSKFKNVIQEKRKSIEDFISPVIKFGERSRGVRDLIYWTLNEFDSPIAIISGMGGIGKTTLSEEIHDILISEYERIITIFITAQQYIKYFKQTVANGRPEYDLYTIYQKCSNSSTILDSNTFYTNLCLGNIVIFFDGIDEVVSTVSNFDLKDFIQSIIVIKGKIGIGKIILNCREIYIKEMNSFFEQLDSNIRLYSLQGFNLDLAKQFFQLNCEGKEKDVDKCMTILNEFYPEVKTNENKYPPFILKIICVLVSGMKDLKPLNYEIVSNYLSSNNNADIITYRICYREIAKKEENGFHLSIDEQLRFFIHLAIHEKGQIEVEQCNTIFDKLKIVDRQDSIIKGISDHPILMNSEDRYTFRFDFYNLYFKSVGLCYCILHNCDSLFTNDRIINILAFECKHNSLFYKYMHDRLKPQRESVIKNIENIRQLFQLLISKINTISDTKSKLRIRIALSNISVLLIELFETTKRREVLNLLFNNDYDSTLPVISNLNLVNIPPNSELFLDFKGFVFSSAYIQSYFHFHRCGFTEETLFMEDCEINEVYSSAILKNEINFSTCNFDRKIKGDNSIHKLLKLKESSEDWNKRIWDFFGVFFIDGAIREKVPRYEFERFVHQKENSIILNFLSAFVRIGIIIESEDKYFIAQKYREKIISYRRDSLPFSELSDVLNFLDITIKENR